MWRDVFEQESSLRAAEQPFVLATVVAYKSPQSAKPGSKAIIRQDGSLVGWVGGGCVQPIVLREAKKVLQTGRPKLLSISPDSRHGDWKGVVSYQMTCEGGGSLEIYLEPVLPKPELIIVGRSPVAQVISDLGRLLDFKVTVADPEATKEELSSADLIVTDLDEVRGHINDASYVVVATMGNGDEEGLLSVVGTTPKYLGLVASEKKSRALFDYAREKGATDEQIARIKCPAGLELGSETLPEIALSVMAEITSVRRAGSEDFEGRSSSLPVVQAQSAGQAIDPICGMTVDIENARYISTFGEQTFYFCCLRCKETFDQNQPQISQLAQIQSRDL